MSEIATRVGSRFPKWQYRLSTNWQVCSLELNDSKIVFTMKTKVSTEGQIVLPGPLRRRLNIHAGDALDAKIEAGRIVLTLQQRAPRKAKVVMDPVTGLPVLSLDSDAPVLSSKCVAEILSNFP